MKKIIIAFILFTSFFQSQSARSIDISSGLETIEYSSYHKFAWVNPPKEDMSDIGLHHKVIESKLLGSNVGYSIFLPPDYDKNRVNGYPLVYFLHGAGGHESEKKPHVEQIIKLINSKTIPPVVFVFPNGGKRTQYEDFFDKTISVFSYMTSELFPHIESFYNIDTNNIHIQGFSAGGWGAVKFAFRTNGHFKSVYTYGGALLNMEKPESAPAVKKQKDFVSIIYGNNASYLRKKSIYTAITKGYSKNSKMDIKITIGDKEKLLELNQICYKKIIASGYQARIEILKDVTHNFLLYIETWKKDLIYLLNS